MDKTIIGLIGCGNIGTIIVNAIGDGRLNATIGSLFDLDDTRARELSELTGDPKAHKTNFNDFIEGEFDLVIEAASIDAVNEYGERVLKNGKDMIILSVGALIDEELRARLERASDEHGSKVFVPSGAIGGLDLLKSASVSGIDEIILTTTKNPESLEDVAPNRRTVIFEGKAKEAVKLYPKNINVAAAISLASRADLKVMIVSDPDVPTNTHEIRAKGKFGEMILKTSNLPSPDNPKTSYLAALSVIRTIQGLEEKIVIGT